MAGDLIVLGRPPVRAGEVGVVEAHALFPDEPLELPGIPLPPAHDAPYPLRRGPVIGSSKRRPGAIVKRVVGKRRSHLLLGQSTIGSIKYFRPVRLENLWGYEAIATELKETCARIY